METVNEKVTSLKFAEYNPRSISKSDFDSLKHSISEFGFVEPVVCNRTTGNIVGGHMRVRAASELGIEEVPVVWIEIDASKEKALNLALNRIHGDWDDQMLAELIYELNAEGFDMSLTGFDDSEVSKLLDSVAGSGEEDDQVPETPEEPTSQKGDMFALGDHILLCGSSGDIDNMARLFENKTAQMVFTDPPYNVNYKGGSVGDRDVIANDSFKSKEDYFNFLHDCIVLWKGKIEGDLYICHSSSEWDTVKRACDDCGIHWSDTLIWAKHNFTLGRANYQRMYEPIFYGWFDKSSHYWSGARNLGDVIKTTDALLMNDKVYFEAENMPMNVWEFPKPSKSLDHPTMKPVALCMMAIKNSSKRGDYVFDPFGGSGSTLIACENLGRKCLTVELEPKYCDVIIKRWEEKTGKEAKKL